MTRPFRRTFRSLLLGAACLTGVSALAAEEKAEWLPEGSLGTGLPMLADPGGLRAALWQRGIKFQLNYIGEVLGNTSGGLQTGARGGGRLELVVDADLEKALGWSGATFHANAFQIHGTGISRYNLANLMAVSNIEALPNTRLFEAWIEQKMFDGKAAFKFGQLAADTEFVTSNYAGLFINGTFGWPTINAADLPSGGPAYPLATPGVRLGLYPTDNLSLLLGIYNGDPAGPGLNDPQQRNRNGLNFRVRDPAFVIGEAQYKYGDEKSPNGLSGVVKVGAWSHFGRFSDQRIGTDGLSLANPASVGTPVQHRGNQGIYGVIDQQVYRLADDPTKGVGVFARISAAPSNRNLVDFYADGGINVSGMVPGRPDDAFGVAVAYARIGRAATALDQDMVFFSGVPSPVRSSEAVVEATYSAQIMPGWTVQPNFQYVMRPGGGVADPSDPTGVRRVRNAAIFGVRTVLKY
jgi:porin